MLSNALHPSKSAGALKITVFMREKKEDKTYLFQSTIELREVSICTWVCDSLVRWLLVGELWPYLRLLYLREARVGVWSCCRFRGIGRHCLSKGSEVFRLVLGMLDIFVGQESYRCSSIVQGSRGKLLFRCRWYASLRFASLRQAGLEGRDLAWR